MGVGEVRTSSKDDADDGYNLDAHEILNSDKEFYKLSLVHAKPVIPRMQTTLQI